MLRTYAMDNYIVLLERIQEANNLIEQKSIYDNVEFVVWKTKTLRLLERIFGVSSREVKTLEERDFHPESWRIDKDTNNMLINWFSKDMQASIAELEEYALEIKSGNTAEMPTAISSYSTNKVFIVHGRDDAAKVETARFIEKGGLLTLILNEQPGKGNTIIEKIEENSDVGFALILYTACDEGKLKGHSDELKNRARQNVIFEHGYFCAKIGRTRVAALVKGMIETPSDISGIEYIPMDEQGAWKYKVAKELQAAGYNVDMNRI